MTDKRKPGRPRLAAQSLDEALVMVLEGKVPKRGRNDFERQAMSKGRNGKRGGGRPVNLASLTQQAALLAAYTVENDSCTIAEAARKASEVYRVNVDNVRRYAAALVKTKTVTIKRSTKQVGATFPSVELLVRSGEIEAELPFLVHVDSLPPR